MRILILEDSTERVKYFLERFSDYELTITENAQDAIIYLNEEMYDYVFLDHDLGLNNGSGSDVASYLGSGMTINSDAKVIIHSWNIPACALMLRLCPGAFVLPYGSDAFFGLEI